MLPWKLFWPALGAVACTAYAAVAALFAMPALLTVAVAAVVAVLVGAAASRVVHACDLLAPLRFDDRETICRFIYVAVAAHVAWLVVWQIRPDLWFAWLVVMGALVAVEYFVAQANEYLRDRPTRAVSREAAKVERDPDNTEKIFTAALTRAKLGWLQVVHCEPVGDFGAAFDLEVPSRYMLDQAGEKSNTTALGRAQAEAIAIALREVLREGTRRGQQAPQIKSDWVQILKRDDAGVYRCVVVNQDVMARVRPYVDTSEVTSIAEPALVGYHLDGSPYYLPLAQHGQVVGKSRSGKSSLINVQFAHITRCGDAVLWICGVQKLYDLVAGWLEPYYDQDFDVPIDWVVTGQDDTLKMLAAAMAVARYRQRVPLRQRGKCTTVIVVLDEASFALRNTTRRINFEGQWLTASQLWAMLRQGAGGGDVWAKSASQRSTYDHGGDQGADASMNVGYSAGFMSNDQAEIGRLTGDYQLPMPRHRGEYWLDPGTGDQPIKLKAPYIQETDPAREKLHSGVTVEDVSWARRNFRHELDAGSAAAAGEVYAGRHRRMNAAMLAYLTNSAEPDVDEPVGVDDMDPDARRGYDTAMDNIQQILANAGLAPLELGAAATADPASPGNVATMVGRKSRAERIVDYVTAAGAPVTTKDIIAALRADGDEVGNETVVTNALSKLVDEKQLVRAERGVYTTSGDNQ